MTSDQAGLLYDLVKEHRAAIVADRSFGVFDGLLQSLAQIDRGGGALLRGIPTVLDYFSGDIIEAAVIPTSTYIAWPSVKTVPRPFWELAAILPKLSVEHEGQVKIWEDVSVYRATSPLAIVPLAAAVLPDPPLPAPLLRSGSRSGSRSPLPLR